MFAVPVAGVVSKASLVALRTIACASDLRTRRIPNWLVLVVAIIGIASEIVTKSWVAGLTQAGEGLATGLLVWLPFYAMRMVGAGDVKLFAAASTFLGPHAAIEAAFYTAVFGGVMALAFMVSRSGWATTFIRVGHAMHQPLLLRNTPSPERRRMPYALAIAAGVLTVIWWPGYMMR
jgi:prepilin peptidase CpaA